MMPSNLSAIPTWTRAIFMPRLTNLAGADIPGSAIGAFHQNQLGGTLGGPIKRDRVFFFGDFIKERARWWALAHP